MSANDRDQFEAYYAEKLWGLLPEVYRASDAADGSRPGPLRELVDRLGAQIAVVRRSIDRTWDDQSIETCDDWVIPYIGDLLGTNLVASLDARGQRLDVAKTIYYRRRKGTVALLEELARDITGWDAQLVEFFRRLGRARHGLDPPIGLPSASADPDGARLLQVAQGLAGAGTATPAGGFADLRRPAGVGRAGSAFDELFYTADTRRGRGRTGWYGIMHLGVFLWRLESIPARVVVPVRDAACPNQYTFDPTGRDVPLFAEGRKVYGDGAPPAREQDMPGPITGRLLRAALSDLYPTSLALAEKDGGAFRSVDAASITADPRGAAPAVGDAPRYFVAPERGRFYALAAPPEGALEAGALRVTYHHGFASSLGAGGYDRRADRGRVPRRTGSLVSVRGGGGLPPLPTAGTVTVTDSLTYDAAPGAVIDALTIAAGEEERPVLRLLGQAEWVLAGRANADLFLDGLWLAGGVDLVLDGDFASVLIDACTLDPGTWSAEDGDLARSADGHRLAASRLVIRGHVDRLEIRRSIVGPIQTEAGSSIDLLRVEDSVVQGLGTARALDVSSGDVELARATVLGEARVHRLSASSAILAGRATVADAQRGCVRFSAWTSGSRLPRQFESVEVSRDARLFAATTFGDPRFATLLATAPAEVAAGAEDGSEMGAFCREKRPIKEKSLLIKYREYMPIGLTPVLVHVT